MPISNYARLLHAPKCVVTLILLHFCRADSSAPTSTPTSGLLQEASSSCEGQCGTFPSEETACYCNTYCHALERCCGDYTEWCGVTYEYISAPHDIITDDDMAEIYDMHLADMDNDGRVDIVVAAASAAVRTDIILWYRNLGVDGDGVPSFDFARRLLNGRYLSKIGIADLDNDGYPDIVADTEPLLVLWNNRDILRAKDWETTELGLEFYALTGSLTGNLANFQFADLDQNGFLDVVVAASTGSDVPSPYYPLGYFRNMGIVNRTSPSDDEEIEDEDLFEYQVIVAANATGGFAALNNFTRLEVVDWSTDGTVTDVLVLDANREPFEGLRISYGFGGDFLPLQTLIADDEVPFDDFRVGNSIPPLASNRFVVTSGERAAFYYTFDNDSTLVQHDPIQTRSNDFILLSDVDLDDDLDLLMVTVASDSQTCADSDSSSSFRVFWNQHHSSAGDTGVPFEQGDPLTPFDQRKYSNVVGSEFLPCFTGIVQGDLNLDGKEDFVNYGATKIGFLLNTHPERGATVAPTPNPSKFSEPMVLEPASHGPHPELVALVAADFNRDGTRDVLTFESGRIGIFPYTKNFSSGEDFGFGGRPEPLRPPESAHNPAHATPSTASSHDLNSDFMPDVLICGEGFIGWMRNDNRKIYAITNHTNFQYFDLVSNFSEGYHFTDCQAADLDGDSDLDVVAFTSNSIVVFESHRTEGTPRNFAWTHRELRATVGLRDLRGHVADITNDSVAEIMYFHTPLVGFVPAATATPFAVVDMNGVALDTSTFYSYYGGEETPPPEAGVGGEETLPPETGVGDEETPPPEAGVGDEEIPPPEAGVGDEETLPPEGGVGGEEIPPPEAGVGDEETLPPETAVGDEEILPPETGTGDEETPPPGTGTGDEEIPSPGAGIGGEELPSSGTTGNGFASDIQSEFLLFCAASVSPRGCENVQVGDFNGDGMTDLMFWNYRGEFTVYTNAGSFNTTLIFDEFPSPSDADRLAGRVVSPDEERVGEILDYQAVPDENPRRPLTTVYFSGDKLGFFENDASLESRFTRTAALIDNSTKYSHASSIFVDLGRTYSQDAVSFLSDGRLVWYQNFHATEHIITPRDLCRDVYHPDWFPLRECCWGAPCEVNNGDCRNDDDCKGDLTCGRNNCNALGSPVIWPEDFNCCYDGQTTFGGDCFVINVFADGRQNDYQLDNGIVFDVIAEDRDVKLQSFNLVILERTEVAIWVTKNHTSWKNDKSPSDDLYEGWINLANVTLEDPWGVGGLVEMDLSLNHLIPAGASQGVYIHSTSPTTKPIVFFPSEVYTVGDDDTEYARKGDHISVGVGKPLGYAFGDADAHIDGGFLHLDGAVCFTLEPVPPPSPDRQADCELYDGIPAPAPNSSVCCARSCGDTCGRADCGENTVGGETACCMSDIHWICSEEVNAPCVLSAVDGTTLDRTTTPRSSTPPPSTDEVDVFPARPQANDNATSSSTPIIIGAVVAVVVCQICGFVCFRKLKAARRVSNQNESENEVELVVARRNQGRKNVELAVAEVSEHEALDDKPSDVESIASENYDGSDSEVSLAVGVNNGDASMSYPQKKAASGIDGRSEMAARSSDAPPAAGSSGGASPERRLDDASCDRAFESNSLVFSSNKNNGDRRGSSSAFRDMAPPPFDSRRGSLVSDAVNDSDSESDRRTSSTISSDTEIELSASSVSSTSTSRSRLHSQLPHDRRSLSREQLSAESESESEPNSDSYLSAFSDSDLHIPGARRAVGSDGEEHGSESELDAGSSDSEAHFSIVPGQKGGTDNHRLKRSLGVDRNGAIQCEICGASIKGVSNYYTHLREQHESQSKKRLDGHACPTCGQMFTRKFNMQVHAKTHFSKRAFPCTLCDESFTQRSNLKRHVHTKHEMPIKCALSSCKTRFKNTAEMVAHFRVAHPDEPQIDDVRPYKGRSTASDTLRCYCKQKFKTDKSLKNHQKTCAQAEAVRRQKAAGAKSGAPAATKSKSKSTRKRRKLSSHDKKPRQQAPSVASSQVPAAAVDSSPPPLYQEKKNSVSKPTSHSLPTSVSASVSSPTSVSASVSSPTSASASVVSKPPAHSLPASVSASVSSRGQKKQRLSVDSVQTAAVPASVSESAESAKLSSSSTLKASQVPPESKASLLTGAAVTTSATEATAASLAGQHLHSQPVPLFPQSVNLPEQRTTASSTRSRGSLSMSVDETHVSSLPEIDQYVQPARSLEEHTQLQGLSLNGVLPMDVDQQTATSQSSCVAEPAPTQSLPSLSVDGATLSGVFDVTSDSAHSLAETGMLSSAEALPSGAQSSVLNSTLAPLQPILVPGVANTTAATSVTSVLHLPSLLPLSSHASSQAILVSQLPSSMSESGLSSESCALGVAKQPTQLLSLSPLNSVNTPAVDTSSVLHASAPSQDSDMLEFSRLPIGPRVDVLTSPNQQVFTSAVPGLAHHAAHHTGSAPSLPHDNLVNEPHSSGSVLTSSHSNFLQSINGTMPAFGANSGGALSQAQQPLNVLNPAAHGAAGVGASHGAAGVGASLGAADVGASLGAAGVGATLGAAGVDASLGAAGVGAAQSGSSVGVTSAVAPFELSHRANLGAAITPSDLCSDAQTVLSHVNPIATNLLSSTDPSEGDREALELFRELKRVVQLESMKGKSSASATALRPVASLPGVGDPSAYASGTALPAAASEPALPTYSSPYLSSAPYTSTPLSGTYHGLSVGSLAASPQTNAHATGPNTSFVSASDVSVLQSFAHTTFQTAPQANAPSPIQELNGISYPQSSPPLGQVDSTAMSSGSTSLFPTLPPLISPTTLSQTLGQDASHGVPAPLSSVPPQRNQTQNFDPSQQLDQAGSTLPPDSMAATGSSSAFPTVPPLLPQRSSSSIFHDGGDGYAPSSGTGDVVLTAADDILQQLRAREKRSSRSPSLSMSQSRQSVQSTHSDSFLGAALPPPTSDLDALMLPPGGDVGGGDLNGAHTAGLLDDQMLASMELDLAADL